MTLNQYLTFIYLIIACTYDPETKFEKCFHLISIILFFVFNHMSFVEFWREIKK